MIQKISAIIPFYNERESLQKLLPNLISALTKIGKPYEIILVDDGSEDNVEDYIGNIISVDYVTHFKLKRKMGKGKALSVGISKAQGDTILFMDADLQDDPEDIHRFVEKIDSGFDFVNGIRQVRRDNFVIKLYSKLAGTFLRRLLHSPFSDINCGFKMFKSKILENVVLYGNNFRFLPLAAFYEGYRVCEVLVNNRPRIYGKSKYGISKLFLGGIDMLSAYFLYSFAEKPLHFFGTIGAILCTIGGSVFFWVTYERIFMGILLYKRPALQYAIFLFILGVQIIMTGIIGELIVYLYHKTKLKK